MNIFKKFKKVIEMSKISGYDDNNEKVDYQIQCIFKSKAYLGYIIVIILYLSLLFTYANTGMFFYGIFIPSFFVFVPTIFIVIYWNTKKDKIDNVIITLIKKEHIEIPDENRNYHYYYFYTDTNIIFRGCERLYNFLQGNETIQVTIKGYSIYGLVKII
jgi:hypothetical protein